MDERLKLRFTGLERRSEEELLETVDDFRICCIEKVKECTKLQEDVQVIQREIFERKENASRKSGGTSISMASNVVLYQEKSKEFHTRLKDIPNTKEGQESKRSLLKEEIQSLEAEYKRLDANHSALLENLANLKCQIEMASKKTPHSTRQSSRREADEQIDDLVKQYMPERLFKSRRRPNDHN